MPQPSLTPDPPRLCRTAAGRPVDAAQAASQNGCPRWGIFVDDAAIVRPVGALMPAQNHEWSLNPRRARLDTVQLSLPALGTCTPGRDTSLL